MTLDPPLDPFEARVLGVLIEKQLTTPDLYPLTLHAVTIGANQKSNRDPFMELLEGDAYAALQKLIRRGLAGSVHPVGARVEKFRHNAEALLKVGTPQVAVLAELLMRGPQQPGELRGRASRMTPIDSLPALTDVLKPLIEQGHVIRVEPSAGSRAERFAQTISPASHPIDARPQPVRPSEMKLPPIVAPQVFERAPASALPLGSSAAAPGMQAAESSGAKSAPLEQRVVELEAAVTKLRRQLDNLAWKLGEQLKG